jgi:cysteine desulfurase
MTYRTHLDYASSAPMRDIVRSSMINQLETSNDFYDPRRLYDDSIRIRYEIEESRHQIANFFGAKPSELIFTSSGDESLAMFTHGIAKMDDKIFLSSFESEIVIRNLAFVKFSQIEMANLETKILPDTYCIFLSLSHPDTGELVEVEKIVSTIRSIAPNCLIHLDARRACGYHDINFERFDVDAMTIESNTWGGPVGIAGLFLRQGLHIEPLIMGASQERGRRSGAENTLAIKGFGTLCTIDKDELKSEIELFDKYKTTINSILKDYDCIIIDQGIKSLPNMLSARFKNLAASAIVAEFNRQQINIHAGSSCGSEEFEISNALLNVGLSEQEAECAFRISWGYATTQSDIENFSVALSQIAKTFS